MKRMFLSAASTVLALGLLLSGCGQSPASAPTSASAAAQPASVAAGETLTQPTDFEFNPTTGEFSFNAVDERTAYYFVRVSQVKDGVESTEYKATSERIMGGSTGEITGTVELPAMGWGTFSITLNAYPAAGSGLERPDAVTLTAEYGVDQILERPEMLAMVSGNQVELIVDWYTLSDYYTYEYLPEMKFTFYSDAECTQEVRSEIVDLEELAATVYQHPMGYNWGSSYSEPVPRYYHSNGELTGFGPYVGDSDYCFLYDIYPYTLDPGTYYVTCQAISKLEYTNDSQVSTPVEITLTDAEPNAEFVTACTELWTDPAMSDIPSVRGGERADRVDFCGDKPLSARIVE